MYNKVKLKNYCKLITHGVITQESDQSTSHHNLVTHCLAMFGHTVDQSHLTSHLITCCLPLFGSVADQSWTVMNPILDFKINNIVKDIRDIKSTFKNRKNNQNSLDKYGEDEKVNKYFSHNNPKYHDRTSNHDIPKHHGLLPTHNDPDTFPINQPLHPTHSCPDIDESGIEPTSSYGFCHRPSFFDVTFSFLWTIFHQQTHSFDYSYPPSLLSNRHNKRFYWC